MTKSDSGPDGVEAPNSIDAHVGRRLKARRLQLRLKLSDLARALEVSIQQVHKYETAKSGLPAEKLLRLARALNVTPAYFFDGLALSDSTRRPQTRVG
jgi:transcriptional regulator with XRE-family HTH domain